MQIIKECSLGLQVVAVKNKLRKNEDSEQSGWEGRNVSELWW